MNAIEDDPRKKSENFLLCGCSESRVLRSEWPNAALTQPLADRHIPMRNTGRILVSMIERALVSVPTVPLGSDAVALEVPPATHRTGGVRVLIIDHDGTATQHLRQSLSMTASIRSIDVCGNLDQAAAAVRRGRPDLLFVDMALAEGRGLERLLEGRAFVAVAATGRFAVRAFELGALDYLVKPVAIDRLRTAIGRADRVMTPSPRTPGRFSGEVSERLAIRHGSDMHLIRLADIDWVSSDGNYARLHVGREQYLVRCTMTVLAGIVADRGFARIHRRTIVNLDRIAEIRWPGEASPFVVLDDGMRLVAQRAYLQRFISAIPCLSGSVSSSQIKRL